MVKKENRTNHGINFDFFVIFLVTQSYTEEPQSDTEVQIVNLCGSLCLLSGPQCQFLRFHFPGLMISSIRTISITGNSVIRNLAHP